MAGEVFRQRGKSRERERTLENVREHSRTRRNSLYILRNASRLRRPIVVPESGVAEVNPEVRLDVVGQSTIVTGVTVRSFGEVVGSNPVRCTNMASLYAAEMSEEETGQESRVVIGGGKVMGRWFGQRNGFVSGGKVVS